MNSYVFISYSKQDEAIAEQLSRTLDEAGIRTFLDQKDIQWGDSITSRIQDAIQGADAVIAIFSPASKASSWVPFEMGSAMALGKRLLLLVTQPSMILPSFLQDIRAAHNIPEVVQALRSSEL